ncbi:hypothetical protein JIR001_09580 [Polycladomyces abyssicola]|uniref:Uncharacterized protein n=1 Tax=Polycladomyces abyssicola TaxID=1125966 RepID=A0A8D5UFS5_9BACL|nr:hypothetical protein JIR001_09580 [Polycladomyces abyssicola]
MVNEGVVWRIMSTLLSRLAPPAPCREADGDRSDPISAGRGQMTLRFEKIARDYNPALSGSALGRGLVGRSPRNNIALLLNVQTP